VLVDLNAAAFQNPPKELPSHWPSRSKGFARYESKGLKEEFVRIISILIAIIALPLMALGQAPDQQQGATQDQTSEKQEKAPAKNKKARPAHEETRAPVKSETGATMHGGTKAPGRTTSANRTEAEPRSSARTQTTVDKQEFRTRHREVFSLGRHPKEFFVQRFGTNHFRLIGNTYFVFVDGCWVAVDVAGFTFVERVICEGDPDYIVVY